MSLLLLGRDLPDTDHYLPSDPTHVAWGLLPTAATAPRLTVRSGETVCVDTISHEGLLADQGRDPAAFFGAAGISTAGVLPDVVALAESGRIHDPGVQGPHVITGPVAVDGAEPGDVLEVEVGPLYQRAPYGVISNRHGRGALPGEYPLDGRDVVSLIAFADGDTGRLPLGDGRDIRFPLNPFLGIMGVAPAGDRPHNSIPPGRHGGNLDVNLFGTGSRLFLPVQVPGALFYVGDPHFAQGDGEVALTAFEAPLRAQLRLTLHRDAAARSLAARLTSPWGRDTVQHIVTGLDRDLDEAMRACTRNALTLLEQRYAVPPAVGLAYLSAAADFEVSQVVDQVQGVHCRIRIADVAPLAPEVAG
ncbi:acetamidase/formamidase family protein [Tsukamurella soli]|uniref:Acetamidase/formamidase family protein n=1 Tax=Tsukamurella soli TaxID=644556 RepID=A0ABP8JTK5_9ACTN